MSNPEKSSSPSQQQQQSQSLEQSSGSDPKSKRNSGLFTFFRWFKLGTSRESIGSSSSRSDSLESVSSIKSAGTVASFAFVSPGEYEKKVLSEKSIQIGPETDTYKARLKQRDKRRECDKNVTLRKKYNLFFNKDSLLKPQNILEDDENSKSLPLMTRAHIIEEMEPQKVHRRTNSESSKLKRAGAYVHVKGKRKAPQPPVSPLVSKLSLDSSTLRKKRLAPTPPPRAETIEDTQENVQNVLKEKDDSANIKNILSNDYLKLDNGVLKPVKEEDRSKSPHKNTQPSQVLNALSPSSSRTSFVEAPVSPRPWYKRNSVLKEVPNKKENKYEPVERLPEVQYTRNSQLDLSENPPVLINEKEKKREEKRKSGLSFLTNISELDREASEIIKNKAEYEKNGVLYSDLGEIPQFMKPRMSKIEENSSLASPKRRTTKDLIAKFNAITNVTKVTVFGATQKDKLFGKQISLDETKQRQELLLESHKKRIEEIDKKNEDKFTPIIKSESASKVKLVSGKGGTPKMDRKSWKCPKCNLENDYWRIICHVCSAIKPYFDDFSSSSKNSEPKPPDKKSSSPAIVRREFIAQNNGEKLLERSKTQIGFSALANYNAQNKKKAENIKTTIEGKDTNTVDETSKKEERERLKKMLIDMKNSLPKRKNNITMKQNSRTSIILEKPEDAAKEEKDKKEEFKENVSTKEEDSPTAQQLNKTQEEQVAEILIGTAESLYENIKLKKTENTKPLKVSSSSQTSALVKKILPEEATLKKLIENHKANNVYEPMKPKDFEDIYSDTNGTSAARIYANLAANEELSLFFNVPKNISNLKTNIDNQNKASASKCLKHTDTIEINRLLRRLETSIAKGELTEAASFAKELAQLKINCSVVRQKPQSFDAGKKEGFQIEMYVEDKVSHRGPFPIDVSETQTVAELKEQIARDFEIPVDVQRWILGKELVIDDSTTLKDHKISKGCPVFLYLVAPDNKLSEGKNPKNKIQASSSKTTAQTNIVLQNTTTQDPKDMTANKNGTKAFTPIKITTNKTEITSNSKEVQQTDHEVNKESIKETKIKDAPKIVNVIPKPAEIIPNKQELAKDISVQNPVKITNCEKNITIKTIAATVSKPSVSVQSPTTVTEIKVEIKPYSPRSQNLDSKEEKKGLVRATTSKVEVLQAPAINIEDSIKAIENSKQSNISLIPNVKNLKYDVLTNTKQLSLSNTHVNSKVSNIPIIATKLTEIPKNQTKSKTESKNTNPILSTPSDLPQTSTSLYPDLSKLSTSPPNISLTPISKVSSQSPNLPFVIPNSSKDSKTTLQNSNIPPTTSYPLGEFDAHTLKAQKEWECDLCTLLNPDSSNICAVCATVRLTKATLKKSSKKKPAPQVPQKDQTYLQLVNLDSTDLVLNTEGFECLVCLLEVPPGEGVTLRECLHQFCKDCLSRTVEFSEDAEVKCPYIDEEYSCDIPLQDREIKALVSPVVYEQYLAKSVAQAENKMDKTFHCKTPDCRGWCIFEDNVNDFRCPVCRLTNCLTCQAIHMGLNCKQYQERMQNESENDEDARRTKDFLEEMVEKGEAIACPTCKVILMKKWGCDWLRCSMCKTEICWVTRGPRWGPGGKGDTSGGCQCGLNGVKCHPKCNYCH